MDDTAGFCLLLFATLGYGAIHSLLASLRAKAMARNLLGPEGNRQYRLFFNTFAVLTLLPVLLLLVLHLGSLLYFRRGILLALSILGQLLALLLFWVVFRQSRPAEFLGLTRSAESGQTENLTTAGAYAIVRHPLYSTGLCALWLIPVMTTGLLAFCLGITLYILVGEELEERRLIGEFGDSYRVYQKKVARLIPFVF
jgi:protein-S-isoprenylcysteine O-methyltransferase Ste14